MSTATTVTATAPELLERSEPVITTAYPYRTTAGRVIVALWAAAILYVLASVGEIAG